MTTQENAVSLLATPPIPRRTDALRRTVAQFTVLDYAAITVILLLVVAVVAPAALTPYDPLVGDDAITLDPPSLAHPLGTDNLGRDVWSRIVHGTSATLLASAVAVALGLGAGTVLGLIAAVVGGAVDAVISRVVDALLSIPGLLLAMVVVVSLGFGSLNAAIAVGVSTVATFARLMRSEVLTITQLPFVEASRHIGGRSLYVLRRHVFPNSFSAVLSLAALQFGIAILWISALSFLGYGAPPPQPEWGLLVSEARTYVVSSPWLVVFPGLAILITVWAVNRLSYSVRGNRNDV
ncbi:ABC transporter permease [Microbacterium sp. SORGH_AS_0862]|uniref:ABC transporter permease n=1 Tax=Microbacterium sp. SORGH_AS_0862 TaxID=3041789 RepID=UPI002790E837|nr:ABC transporter permease [Microbacterium sp. SORGH_AS_0862]MDQ1205334.1 peptide/nickel transport system permease protein [Microbacterium sp. SORGH_AS_0862]